MRWQQHDFHHFSVVIGWRHKWVLWQQMEMFTQQRHFQGPKFVLPLQCEQGVLPSATWLRQGNVFTGFCHSVHRGVSGRDPPGRHPLGRHLPGRHPGQAPPGRHPPRRHPPRQTATAADGRHPAGIHSCSWKLDSLIFASKHSIGNGLVQMFSYIILVHLGFKQTACWGRPMLLLQKKIEGCGLKFKTPW